MTPTSPGRPPALDRRDAWWIAVVALVGVAIRWGVLSIGPVGDDYIQYGMVTGQYPGHYAPYDLYALYVAEPATRAAHLQAGFVPWWTAADVYATVFRPLPSALLWLDHTVFPQRFVVHHLHSMLWWALSIVTAGLVLRRLFDRPIAWVALAFFALDHGVTRPLAFHANRAVLITATFGFLALLAHIRWREDGLRHGAVTTMAAMVATFATGEYALVIVAYVLAYEVVVGKIHRAGPRAWARRLWPTLGIAAAYMALHVAGGYGTIGSEYYAHPFDSPGGYARWAVTRIPRLLADLVVSMPAAPDNFVARYGYDPGRLIGDPGFMATIHGHALVAGAALLLTGVLVWIVRSGYRDAERRAILWLSLAAVLGTFPVAVAPSHSRLLLLSHLGGVVFVAGLVVAAARIAAGRVPAGRWRRGLAAIVVVALTWVHAIADVDFARRMTVNFARFDQDVTAIVRSPLHQGQSLRDRDVILMSAKGLNVSLHGALVASFHGFETPRSWHVLSSTHAPLNVLRTGPRTLELWHMLDETWLAAEVDRAFCPRPRTIPAGTVIDTGVFVLRVLADVEGRPSRVELTFEAPLEDPRYLFVFLRDKRLETFRLPRAGGISFVPVPNESSTAQRIPPSTVDVAVKVND